MSEQTAETRIVKHHAQKSLQFVETNPQRLAERLKNMIVGGRKLSDPEIIALAQYSVATGLNPFTGECFYLPGIGPGPGIAGWRVKASEQLEYEAQRNRIPTANFWCEAVKLGKDEFDGDPEAGDVAYKMILHDSLTKQLWEEAIIARSIRIQKEMGADFKTSWEMAKDLVGSEPVWTGIGVVHNDERFSGTDNKGNQKPEMWDRNERAQKRGEKLAIRKRFTRVYLPEPLGFEPDFIDSTMRDVTNGEPKQLRDPNVVMAELGIVNGTKVETATHTPLEEVLSPTESIQSGVQIEPPMPEEPITPQGLPAEVGLVNMKVFDNINEARNALKHCTLPSPNEDQKVAWAELYVRWRKETGATVDQAAKKANEGKSPE